MNDNSTGKFWLSRRRTGTLARLSFDGQWLPFDGQEWPSYGCVFTCRSPHGIAILRALFVALVALGCGSAAAAGEKLNVLFIAVDDLRPALGCYGNAIVQSPQLDKFATQAVRFDRAYVQFPLCNPSRASMLTGRYPTTTKVMDNDKNWRNSIPDAVSLPEHFRKHGYFTARTGKIFHGGIDDGPSWSEGGEPATGDRPPRTPQQNADRRKDSDRWVATETEDDQPDFKTATRAIELLEAHQDEPFFIAVGFNKPHSPLIAPKKYFDLYDAEKIPLPPDFAARPHALPGAPEIAILRGGIDLFIGRDASPAEARDMIRAYYACISFVDVQVGRVLGKLDELKLRDRTVIVFWGDHGYHLGEKGKWSKHGSLYEVATRVPLMIHAPGVSADGQTSPRTVEAVDLYPTLAELCSLPQPAGLEGNSLVPLLKNPAAAWSHPAFTVVPKGKTVRTERWRYTEWEAGTSGIELYDEHADPHEMNNLANEAKFAETLAMMKSLLQGDWKTVRSSPAQTQP